MFWCGLNGQFMRKILTIEAKKFEVADILSFELLERMPGDKLILDNMQTDASVIGKPYPHMVELFAPPHCDHAARFWSLDFLPHSRRNRILDGLYFLDFSHDRGVFRRVQFEKFPHAEINQPPTVETVWTPAAERIRSPENASEVMPALGTVGGCNIV